MTEQNVVEAVESFDISDLDAADEAHMTVLSNGKLTNWTWTFAGPGHPKTVALSNRLTREVLHEEKLKEQAQANRKKWSATEETPEQVINRTVGMVVDRLIGWSPVKINGEPYPFSPDNARAILSDPRKGALLTQALEFIGDEKSFTRRSDKG